MNLLFKTKKIKIYLRIKYLFYMNLLNFLIINILLFILIIIKNKIHKLIITIIIFVKYNNNY